MALPSRRHAVNGPALTAWRKAKFGMFVHWGIYSVPAGIWEGRRIPRLGEQIQRHARIPREEYASLARQFNPVKYDARSMARLARDAGMRYIVFTAKHHDGFCMFRTAHTDFNIVDATPYGRDVLEDLAEACDAEGLRLGLYYSNPDWHYAGAVERQPENAYAVFEPFTPEHLAYSFSQLRELLTQYGPIFELFFDMGLPTLEESEALARTVHECQPDCLVSGRVMNNQGDFLTLPDNHLPEDPIDAPWESPSTFYHTWGHKSYIEQPPIEEQVPRQLRRLARTAGLGGNYLLNIGPLSDGSVHPYEQEVLRRMGAWMNTHGEAIHGTEPGPLSRLSWGHATQRNGSVYLLVTRPPADGRIRLPGVEGKVLSVGVLNGAGEVPVTRSGEDLVIDLPDGALCDGVVVLECRCEGRIEVGRPVTRQQGEDAIRIEGGDERSEGFHNSLQYNTNIPDIRKRWDVLVNEPGTYQVELEYRLEGRDMPVLLRIGDRCLKGTLAGEHTTSQSDVSDGNELTDASRTASVRRLPLGTVKLTHAGLQTVELVKDGDHLAGYESPEQDAQILQSPQAREIFLRIWTAHRQAMARSSLSGLQVTSILLRREDPAGHDLGVDAPQYSSQA